MAATNMWAFTRKIAGAPRGTSPSTMVCDGIESNLGFAVFVSNHAKFLLYWTGDLQTDWWPVRLRREGYSLQLLSADWTRKVYLVRAKGSEP